VEEKKEKWQRTYCAVEQMEEHETEVIYILVVTRATRRCAHVFNSFEFVPRRRRSYIYFPGAFGLSRAASRKNSLVLFGRRREAQDVVTVSGRPLHRKTRHVLLLPIQGRGCPPSDQRG
jgi:hypothetical protein